MKVISQETFDQVVLEGVNDFDNPIEVAIKDAIEEFEAQGVQLANIATNVKLSEDKQTLIHDVLRAITVVEKYNENEENEANVLDALETFTTECKTSLAHRVLANTRNSYRTLIKFLEKEQSNTKLLEAGLKSITSLTTLNSDILEIEGAALMIQLLHDWTLKDDGSDCPYYLASWCNESCVKHEMNRQNLVKNKVQGKIVTLMVNHKTNPNVVKMCARALRGFLLDDDIRIDFSKAHDHARELVEEHNGIPICFDLLKDWLNGEVDGEVTFELLATVSRQCVRAEYCQLAVDHGGLAIINDILISFPDVASLNKVAINLLKTISGNDQVKEQAMKSGAQIRIVAALDKHQSNPGVCEAGCAAISMLALREPKHAQQLMELGGGQAVVQAMKIHPKNKKIQVLGCMAIRNLAARMPDNKKILLEYNAHEVVREALQTHGESIKDQATAALRDMDVDVHLSEQWTGSGHEIAR